MKRFASSCVGIALLAAAPAWADDHRPDRSGHPLAIIGAVLHPVGWLLDTLIFRPAHWLEHHEPLKTIEGHDDD